MRALAARETDGEAQGEFLRDRAGARPRAQRCPLPALAATEISGGRRRPRRADRRRASAGSLGSWNHRHPGGAQLQRRRRGERREILAVERISPPVTAVRAAAAAHHGEEVKLITAVPDSPTKQSVSRGRMSRSMPMQQFLARRGRELASCRSRMRRSRVVVGVMAQPFPLLVRVERITQASPTMLMEGMVRVRAAAGQKDQRQRSRDKSRPSAITLPQEGLGADTDAEEGQGGFGQDRRREHGQPGPPAAPPCSAAGGIEHLRPAGLNRAPRHKGSSRAERTRARTMQGISGIRMVIITVRQRRTITISATASRMPGMAIPAPSMTRMTKGSSLRK